MPTGGLRIMQIRKGKNTKGHPKRDHICFIYIENGCDTRRWVTINILRVNYITIFKEKMKLHRQITNELIGQEEIEMFIY